MNIQYIAYQTTNATQKAMESGMDDIVFFIAFIGVLLLFGLIGFIIVKMIEG